MYQSGRNVYSLPGGHSVQVTQEKGYPHSRMYTVLEQNEVINISQSHDIQPIRVSGGISC